MTKSFLFPEIDSERALSAPNENGLRRCFSPGSFAVFERSGFAACIFGGVLPRRRRGWFELFQVFCTKLEIARWSSPPSEARRWDNDLQFPFWRSRQESNPHQSLRRALFYPLNYGSERVTKWESLLSHFA